MEGSCLPSPARPRPTTWPCPTTSARSPTPTRSAHLRDEAPIDHNERYDFWALSRHSDIEGFYEPFASAPMIVGTVGVRAADLFDVGSREGIVDLRRRRSRRFAQRLDAGNHVDRARAPRI